MAEIFDLEKYAKTADRAESASFGHLFGDLPDRFVSWVILNQFSELFSAVGFIL